MGWFNKGSKKLVCAKDKETNALVCDLRKRNSDGTEEVLAHIRAEQDANCTPVITESEGNPDDLQELEKHLMGKMKGGCPKNRPQDY